jgi:hypothetical protein
MHYCLCSHLPVKGPGTRRIMATVSRVPVALAPAHGTKGVIHSVDGRRSVYRQIYKELYTWVRGRKVAKGMRKVLEERGLWRPGKKLKPDTLYFSTRH